MKKGPFKMKASKEGPMKKNFGIGSPMKESPETGKEKFTRVKNEARASSDKATTLANNYGGTWTKKGTSWRNQDNQTVKEAAISQNI